MRPTEGPFAEGELLESDIVLILDLSVVLFHGAWVADEKRKELSNVAEFFLFVKVREHKKKHPPESVWWVFPIWR
jgi:hypothetical protein